MGYLQGVVICERLCMDIFVNVLLIQVSEEEISSILLKYIFIFNLFKILGFFSVVVYKVKIKFRVLCYFGLFGSWFIGVILEDLCVFKGIVSLFRRVCFNDFYIIYGAVLGVCFYYFYSIYYFYILVYTVKNGVFVVKLLGGSQGYKELVVIGVWFCIGYCENFSFWWEKGKEERV